MKELIQYLKAKELKLNQPSILSEIEIKFKDKNVRQILNKLLNEGLVFEPKLGVYRWLGE